MAATSILEELPTATLEEIPTDILEELPTVELKDIQKICLHGKYYQYFCGALQYH